MVLLVMLTPVLGESAAGEVPRAAPVTVVALGTSLTASNDWQRTLARALEACWGAPVQVLRVAESARTSAWGREQIERVAGHQPDVVLVEFAMNDANWRRLVSRAESRANTVAIGEGIRRRVPGVAIYLMTTNNVHGLRGLMRPSVASYYEQYRDIAREHGFGLVDAHRAWRSLPAETLRRLVPDGVHPTLAAFEEVAIPVIVSALTAAGCPSRG